MKNKTIWKVYPAPKWRWSCAYEWNLRELDEHGGAIEVYHGDTLNDLVGNSYEIEQLKKDIKDKKVLINLQRWQFKLDEDGEEDNHDFDYYEIDENWKLDKVSSYYGKPLPKRFQKELDKYLKGDK